VGRLTAATLACTAGAVLIAAGDPTAGSPGPDAAVAPVAALLSWVVVGWIWLAVLLNCAGRLPGVAGRLAGRASRLLVPRLLRRVAETVLGVAVVAAPLATPAAAAHRPWPDLDRATTGDHHSTGGSVVVTPGDCLWRIAARDLRDGGTHVDDVAVARSWPQWYAANRDVIGGDPDLIHPGQVLTRPQRSAR
jgi:nucleoid-associated protein YgaU